HRRRTADRVEQVLPLGGEGRKLHKDGVVLGLETHPAEEILGLLHPLVDGGEDAVEMIGVELSPQARQVRQVEGEDAVAVVLRGLTAAAAVEQGVRSEEHTSEL